MTEESNLTNLNFAIDMQLGVYSKEELSDIFSKVPAEEDKESYELKFHEFYENDQQTGFYVHKKDLEKNKEEEKKEDENKNDKEGEYLDDKSEVVHYFNYNTEKKWWYIDEQNDSTIVFFDNSGKVTALSQDPKFFELYQQKEPQTLLSEFYNNYDYALVLIYHTQKGEKQLLEQIQAKIPNTSKSHVAITPHTPTFNYDTPEKPNTTTPYQRISIFVSKYDFIIQDDDQDQAQKNKQKKEVTIEDLYSLLNSIRNAQTLIIPTIVKEEIKVIINSDFGEVSSSIQSYCEEHRYECLYDSESDVDNQSDSDDSEGQSVQEDDSDQSNSDTEDVVDNDQPVFVEQKKE